MTADRIKDRINQMISHFTFEYNGKNCGVDPFSKNDFDIWCGNDFKSVVSIDEVMNMPFFDNKSLSQIADEIKIIDW